MKKLIFNLTTALILFVLLAQPLLAQSESPSPTPAVDDEEINQNIKERIEKLTQDADSIAGTKTKAVVGSVQSLTNNTITIKVGEETTLVSFDDETTIVRNPGNKTVDRADIAIGDFIIAMGTINGSEVLESKRIVLSSEAPESLDKTTVMGTISSITTRTREVVLTKTDGSELTVYTNTNSTLEQKGLNEELALADLEEDQKVIVVYTPAEDEDDDNVVLSLLIISSTEASPEPSPTPDDE